ncbi:MAG: FAD-dependent oxidoreductase [Erysipelotrichaceae bacterium]
MKKWKCIICGAIVEGDTPPVACPVCGVGPELFEEVIEEAISEVTFSTANSSSKAWKCIICGAIVEGETTPSICPVCGVGSEMFELVAPTSAPQTTDTNRKVVIIGNGIAGVSAATTLREYDKTAEIMIISRDANLSYNRPMLTKRLATNPNINDLLIHDEKFYRDQKITVMLNHEVVSINTDTKQIKLSSDKLVDYDELVIATGSNSFIPPIQGINHAHVHALRTYEDARAIYNEAKKLKSIAILGGGVLGIEAACSLYELGIKIHIIESGDRIMKRQLDSLTSKFVEKSLEDHHVILHKNVSTDAITTNDDGLNIYLSNSDILSVDMILISTGVRSELKLIEGTNIKAERSILVDEHMRTSVPNIYACGDNASYEGINYNLYTQALEMGKVAGANIGNNPIKYEQMVPNVTFKLFENSIFAIGDLGNDKTKDYQVVTYSDELKKIFKCQYFINDKFVGGVIINAINDSKNFIDAYINHTHISKIKVS